MRRMKGAWFVFGVFGLLTAVASAETLPNAHARTGRIDNRSLVCMIDDNLQSQPGLTYVYQGKTYYLCCAGCLKRFAGDPERFSQAKDPVSGQQVDKAQALIYSYEGQAYFFGNEAHLKAFAKEPAQFLQQAQPSSGDGAPLQHQHQH